MLKQRAIGTFSNYEVTETALRELQGYGFLMDQVSVVGRDISKHTETTGANTSNRLTDIGNQNSDDNAAEESAKKGAVAGSALGGVTGLLVGLGAIAIPGIGPVMLAGAAATAIATAVSGSVIGAAAGSLAGGLVGLGIPEDRAHAYSERVAHGDYLVMVEGSEAEITMAQSVFSNHGIRDWRVYDLPITTGQTVTTSVTRQP
jgi:hypothetical protein